MAAFFLDSSALVKAYVQEVGSLWMQSIVTAGSGKLINLSTLTSVEVISAITRRRQSGSLLPGSAATALNQFRLDLATRYTAFQITPTRIGGAMGLAEHHGLRGADAIQLATALHVAARLISTQGVVLTLVSADAELNIAARAEGLAVDDPNAHP